MHLCTHSFLHAKKQPENAVSHIKEHVADDSLAADVSNNIAQVLGSAKSSSFDPSSSSIRHQSQSTNFCLSSYSRISNDDLTNWAERAYESNPAAGPHFYSMPLIKAEDSATKSNRDLDYKTHLCNHPFLHAKKQPENTVSHIKEHVENFSPRIVSLEVGTSNIATPVTCSTKTSMFLPSSSVDPSSSTICPQTPSMTCYGAESANEGGLSASSVMQTLREPILTPSVSPFSLNVFPDDDWESFVW